MSMEELEKQKKMTIAAMVLAWMPIIGTIPYIVLNILIVIKEFERTPKVSENTALILMLVGFALSIIGFVGLVLHYQDLNKISTKGYSKEDDLEAEIATDSSDDEGN